MKKSKGFALLEISLALIISAIVAYAFIVQQARDTKRSVAKIQADQLAQIADAVDSYADLYRQQLAAGGNMAIDLDRNGSTDVTIPAVPAGGQINGGKLSPTIAQLQQLGLLNSGFNTSAVATAGTYVVRLKVFPAGCSATINNCRIDGYVALSQPVTAANGSFDADIMGDILTALGGNGFATIKANQDAFGAGGNFTQALDLDNNGTTDTTNPAGIVGVRVGALANRIELNDPIADVDYCPGIQNIGWTGGSLTATTLTDAQYNSFDSGGGSTKKCKAPGFSDVPTGFTFSILDSEESNTGYVRLKCAPNPSAPGTVGIQVLKSCCEGNGC